MRYAQFDYFPEKSSIKRKSMENWWADHWRGRIVLKEDLSNEPVWPIIKDVLKEPGILLEAGCGPGQWVKFFDKLGHVSVGIDYASATLRAARKFNNNLRMIAGDLRSLPFAGETLDYIFSAGAIEHNIDGPEAALLEFSRVLKPSGFLMCSVPCLNIKRQILLSWFIIRDWLKKKELLRKLANKTQPFKFYEYIFSPGSYKKILEKCGFQILDLRPYGYLGTYRINEYLRFYNPHMMMAICRKEHVSQR